MKLHSLIATALVLAASAASAEDVPLSGMAEEVIASEWSDPTSVGERDLFVLFKFDALPGAPLIELYKQSFEDVIYLIGGQQHTSEIFEGSAVDWVCYDTGDTRTTVASLSTGYVGVPAPDLIVEEDVDSPSPACSAKPGATAADPFTRLPGIGGSVADLVERFGTAPVDANGHLAYVSAVEIGGSFEGIQTQIVYYRIENELITGVAYRQRFEPRP